MAVEDIVEKIIKDAEEEANLLISAAQARAQEHAQTLSDESERSTKEIAERAEKDAAQARERILSRARREASVAAERARREAIDEAYDRAAERLCGTEDSDALFRSLLSRVPERIVLRVPVGEKERFSRLCESVSRSADIREDASISCGFIAEADGAEYDMRISSLLNRIRGRSESRVAGILFGETI